MKRSRWKSRLFRWVPGLFLGLLVLLFSHLRIPFTGSTLLLLPAIPGVYYWLLYRPTSLPFSALLVLAIMQDVLYGIVLGSSLLLFLMLKLIADWMRTRLMLQQFISAWISFAPIMLLLWLLLSLVQTVVHPIMLGSVLDAFDFTFLLTWLLYPLFHILFNWCYYQLPQEL